MNDTYDSVFNQLTSYTDELGRKTLYDLDTNTGNVRTTTRVVGQLDSLANGETDDVVEDFVGWANLCRSIVDF